VANLDGVESFGTVDGQCFVERLMVDLQSTIASYSPHDFVRRELNFLMQQTGAAVGAQGVAGDAH